MPNSTYKSVTIDLDKNMLICSTQLVGLREIVEVFSPDETTGNSSITSIGRILEKVDDPNIFVVRGTFEGHEAIGKEYALGEKFMFRVLKKSLSGIKRRKFKEQSQIVDWERDENTKERRVVRAKTGTVRKKSKRK
jgi:hypothetical protein